MPNVSNSVNNFPVQETQKAKKIQELQQAKPPAPAPTEPPPNIIDGIDGNHFLPGGCVIIPADIFKDGPSQIIDQTLDTALLAKMPGAEKVALSDFYGELKGMTPGELDDMKDAIVKQMASPDASQRERDVLKKMYEIADAMSENRPVPHVFPKEKWNHWDKLNPIPQPPTQLDPPGGGHIFHEDIMEELK